jgi:hypothetical protein
MPTLDCVEEVGLSTISLVEGLASRENEGIPDTGTRTV